MHVKVIWNIRGNLYYLKVLSNYWSTYFCPSLFSGDSGGPLNYYNPITKKEELVGIVSWGIGCAAASYPGVYADVASLYTWVKQNMK